ncbi:MAG: GDSL-type esterase/lipase family protein [Pirellulaceae bacterium]
MKSIPRLLAAILSIAATVMLVGCEPTRDVAQGTPAKPIQAPAASHNEPNEQDEKQGGEPRADEPPARPGGAASETPAQRDEDGQQASARVAQGPALAIEKGDHICLVGNALGERMQHHDYFESLLHQRFAGDELVVRNLCIPGDEPLERLRSLNFGSPDEHLAHSKASVILFFLGFNESFAGHEGLEKFTADLTRLVEETKTKNYSGDGPPRMVLVSPIAFEDAGDEHCSDGEEQNHNLEHYTEAMGEVAEKTGVGFVDLYHPTLELFEKSDGRLTLNGAHLNEDGYRALAPILDGALFGSTNAKPTYPEKLQAEIADKNFHWWHRYRAVNGYSIWGTRGEAGFDGTYRNRDVMERERSILDQMTANRDARIWQVAQGEPVPEMVDDSNTLPFFETKTNVGGADDQQRKLGKLGSLDYIPAAEQQKLFKLAPGYEIELVASEEQFPELANPVSMNFDSQGRLWVSTMQSYPQWQPKTKLDDKLLILEDKDGDGRADDCKVFADGLHQPTGFEIGAGGVFVAQQPDILFLKDTDGDDQADLRYRRLVGFDTADSHHGISAFEWGPGGGLYFQEGTFKQSQVETPQGPARLSDAGVWRYEPRTEKFAVHASLAFANPWGHVFDRWGQNFIADASPGFNYWAAPITGRVEFPDKHPGGSRKGHLDWGGSKSDREYPVFIKKRMRPSSGCEFVSSRQFPEEAQGVFLVNNVIGDLGVLQYAVREEGSGFGGEEIEPLVLSEHGNFRPVDLQFGPEGALYIVDWHNALIGHLQHNLRDPSRDHSHGRIWRVKYKDRPLLEPPTIAGAPVADLVKLLEEPEDRTRYRVRRELAERDPAEVLAAVDAWLAGLDPSKEEFQHHQLEALWMYQTFDEVNEALLQKVLHSPDHRARAAATRVLSYWLDRVDDPLATLESLVKDAHPRVRLEAVRACSFIESPRSMEVALESLNYDMDYFLEYTLDETIRALEASLGSATTTDDHAAHDPAAHDSVAHAEATADMPAPLVFLDKSPKVVRFQLDRLPASRLLLIERNTDDAIYIPVFEQILVRTGVSRQDREEAVAALAKLSGVEPISVLLSAVGGLDWSQPNQKSVVEQLSGILLRQPQDALAKQGEALRTAAADDNEALRAVAHAALVAAGDAEVAWTLAADSPQGRIDFLAGLPLLPAKKMRAAQRDRVLECLDMAQPLNVRRAALVALAAVPAEEEQNFRLAAESIDVNPLRAAAVQTMLRIPADKRPVADAQNVVESLVVHAEKTPAAKRTTPVFLDAMTLADELLAGLPVEQARGYRARLREVVVRVVRINTVHEEMRYDTPYFAVEAGRPVQLVLRNEDLMSHNLVITPPGKLRDVAQEASLLGPEIDKAGRQYVPKSENVLFSTRMVEPHTQDVLTFTAPDEPGEYNYVCTFPNHWMRMYGVMVVVPDLDAWLASPTVPADPLGNTRALVQNWTLDDFPADPSSLLANRSTELGQRLFKEATCLQCHKLKGEGGAVGPELTEVFKRHKGDARSVLREMLDPSHTVDPKYALYNLLTVDGKVISGVVTQQSRDTITLVSNPENPKPQVLLRDDIEEMNKSSLSLMPKGLLDRYTQDEIYELLSLLQIAGPQE